MANAYIFIGRSGCGKGTQAHLLREVLEGQGNRRLLYVETGDIFRDFITGQKFANKKSNELYESAVRQPDFLACHMWTGMMLDTYEEGMDVIFDGTPRSLNEAQVLATSFQFFGFDTVHVIHLDVSRDWSLKHLLARGRSDDANSEKINKRLDWYEKDVVPALDFYRTHPSITFHVISGEQPISDVSSDIKKSLGE